MTIRSAIPQDAPAIAHVHVATWQATYAGLVPQPYLDSLEEQAFAGKWTEWLALPGIVIGVAESDNGIIGFASGGLVRQPITTCDAELYAIYVLPHSQHQGIGSQLVSYIEAALQKRHHTRILAWVLRDNPATAFYRRLDGTLVAEQSIEIGGVSLPELAYAWPLRKPINGNAATEAPIP